VSLVWLLGLVVGKIFGGVLVGRGPQGARSWSPVPG